MELTRGWDFLKKYGIIPKEAMALESIGRGIVWHNPIYHTDPKQWKTFPCQWTDFYTHEAKNGIVIQIRISYGFNEIMANLISFFSNSNRSRDIF